MENEILNDRIQKASEISKIPTSYLELVIEDIGVDVLEAETTTFDDFKDTLNKFRPDFSNPSDVVPESISVRPHVSNTCIEISKISNAKLKAAWEILKGNDPFKKKKNVGSADIVLPSPTVLAEALKPVENYSDLELLQKYGKECPPRVEEELQKRTHGRPCIIFEEDTGKIDVENSLYMVRKAHRQDTPKNYMIRGELKVLYPIGFFPADVFYECPVHSKILLVDGYCEECAKVWDTTEHDKNAFLRLITEREDIDIRIYKAKSFAELKQDFPKIYLNFNELKEEDRLPSLKRRLSKSKEGDPFRVVHTTH